MAARLWASGLGGVQAHGAFLASLGGWKFSENGSVNNTWIRQGLNNSSPVGTFRQNNDGPGFTGNRTTTTPDLYRPIPFKLFGADVITPMYFEPIPFIPQGRSF